MKKRMSREELMRRASEHDFGGTGPLNSEEWFRAYGDGTDLILAPWVSARTYFPGTKRSRTYIVNEKAHSCLQLDGLSSDFWHFFNESAFEELSRLIEENGMKEDAKEFLRSLREEGLLVPRGEEEGSFSSEAEAAPPSEEEGREYADFLNERSRWLFENGFMGSLFLELTYRCNLKCIHCYNPKGFPEVEIPFEKACEIVEEAYRLGCCSVTLSGGESTTYSHFLELVRYIRRLRMSCSIFTNGVRLGKDEKLYKDLMSLYPSRISVSLYGIHKEAHEAVTDVPGSYEATLSLVERLRKDGLDVQAKDFLLKENCGDCIALKKWANGKGVPMIADISLIPTIEGDRKTFDHMVGEEELYRLFVDPDSPLYLGKEYRPMDIESEKDSSPCFGGFSGLCVGPTLEVTPCVSLPLSLGNLGKESLSSIWEKGIRKEEGSVLGEWLSVTIADLPDCYRHDYCRWCRYCPGMGYLENGHLRKSDVQCMQAKARMRAYKKIHENDPAE